MNEVYHEQLLSIVEDEHSLILIQLLEEDISLLFYRNKTKALFSNPNIFTYIDGKPVLFEARYCSAANKAISC